MDSAGGPPFATELVDADPRFKLVVERRELERWESSSGASRSSTTQAAPPFAPELVTDQPPHLEELA